MTTDFRSFTTHNQYVQDIMERFQGSTHWTDSQVSSLTVLIADALGDLGVSNSYATRFAAREAFAHLARRDSSIYASMRMLGIPISRKTPSRVRVRVTNNSPESVNLSKYEPFAVEGKPAVLSEPCIIAQGATQELDLIMGVVFEQRIALGVVEDYASVTLSATDFQLGADLEVYTENTLGHSTHYHLHEEALFSVQENEPAYLDLTTDDGGVMLQFGGKHWGRKPESNSTLVVRGLQSNGTSSNSDSLGFKAVAQNHPRVQGTSISTISGGSNEKPIDFYKVFGPVLGPTKRKLIRKDEWRAGIILYPDVADVVIQAQRDIAPNDKHWMGVVRVCVLPMNTSSWGGINPNPDSAQWTAFTKWLAKFHGVLEVQRWNPTKLPIDLHIEVAIFDDSTLNKEQFASIVRKAVYDLFERKPGMLGKRLALSDITDAVKMDKDKRRPEVDYVNILSPSKDIIPNSMLEYVALRNLKINVKYSERT